jgi:hypothetical protein
MVDAVAASWAKKNPPEAGLLFVNKESTLQRPSPCKTRQTLAVKGESQAQKRSGLPFEIFSQCRSSPLAKRRPPQKKLPLLPPWLATALAFAVPKLVGGVLLKVGGLLAALFGLG